jgi:LacI family transcriptional regulator
MNIKEIAKEAGVSVATISRVMNHPEQVLPETCARVLAVMKKHNYIPNLFARGLNLGETKTIALLVPNIESAIYQMVISGIETVALSKEHSVLLCNTRCDALTERGYIEMVVSRQVDGIILVASLLEEKHTEVLIEKDIPCVHIGKKVLKGCHDRCYINYADDANKMTSYLVSHGYETIDLLLEEKKNEVQEQIGKGYKAAISEALGYVHGNIHFAENSVQGGYIQCEKLIEEKLLPRALLTSNDYQALGVMKAAQVHEIKVPEELAIASMTDSQICPIVQPPLTCMDIPAKRLGMLAARMLFDIIEDKNISPHIPQEVILQSTLKIRRSCGNTKNIYELFE